MIKPPTIIYDITIDIKILETIDTTKEKTVNMTKLRTDVLSNSQKLDDHIENLERWGYIKDEKAEGNGKPRKISLILNHDFCMMELLKLKSAIERINKHFQ